MDYLERAATLPLPTPEQTARFADYVASSHSWYKHLPYFPPGARFVFYLAPAAGQEVRENGGKYSVLDVPFGESFAHHSQMATADYREQFGLWEYWVADNPRVLEPQEGPWVYGLAEGRRERLPAGVAERWSCRCTAFLQLGPIHPSLFQQERERFAGYAAQNPNDSEVERYTELAREGVHDPGDVWRNPRLASFAVAEAAVQKQRVLRLLQAIRVECAER
ncbi:MAG TPA: hypothetical protein VFA70_01370 [Dehalococcoidia bacterium]|jgi:hypothetical protein|nr:hypothetical protein [Dehalococcoidia bacterium]